jgi:hypothetical protein
MRHSAAALRLSVPRSREDSEPRAGELDVALPRTPRALLERVEDVDGFDVFRDIDHPEFATDMDPDLGHSKAD